MKTVPAMGAGNDYLHLGVATARREWSLSVCTNRIGHTMTSESGAVFQARAAADDRSLKD